MAQESVELVEVTPDLAREWLGLNSHNRNLRYRVVNAYAADMASGNWRWNGESIKFSKEGALLDGQHRLNAIVEADTTISMLIVRGLPNEAQETVDNGVTRKFHDVLKLRNELAPIQLAATLRRICIWEAGFRDSNANFSPTNAQLLQVLEKYPWVRDLAHPSIRVATGCALPASIVGFAWWLFTQIDNEDAEFFFERLGDGQGLVKGDPIYELRRTAESSKTVRGQRSQRFLTAITIKAWNAYRDGEKVTLYRFRPGGAKPEKFPEPH